MWLAFGWQQKFCFQMVPTTLSDQSVYCTYTAYEDSEVYAEDDILL